MSIGTPMKFGFWEVLSREDLESIHASTLEVLERTGVAVEHREARDALAEAGADVEGTRVRIPSRMVEEAVSSAPGEILIFTRDGNEAMRLAPGHCYYGTGSDVLWITDPETGRRCTTSLDTIRMTSRLADALDNLDFVMSMGTAREIPVERQDQCHMAAMVECTSKPLVVTSRSRRSIEEICELAALVRGGADAFRAKPFCLLYSMPSSPLVHSREALDGLLVPAENAMPCIYSSGIMYGGTGPITISGTLIVSNAEMLSALVIQQLHRPGAPFIHGPISSPIDMRTAVNYYNGPESMIAKSAEAQLARFYDLPSFSFGGCSDAKLFDIQAASEAAMSLLAASLAGGNLIHDVGYLESGLHANPYLMTWADEIIGQVRFMFKGIDVSAEARLVNAIDEIGPGGHYLSHPSTLKRFRECLWMGTLTDRRNYAQWQTEGGKDGLSRARERTLTLLRDHVPSPLPQAVHEAIWKIARGE